MKTKEPNEKFDAGKPKFDSLPDSWNCECGAGKDKSQPCACVSLKPECPSVPLRGSEENVMLISLRRSLRKGRAVPRAETNCEEEAVAVGLFAIR
jgi:hypothetical protein